MKQYQLKVVFENNDYIVTYFNAERVEEIVEHYRGYEFEYCDGETTTTHSIEIKDKDNNDLMTYYYGGVC